MSRTWADLLGEPGEGREEEEERTGFFSRLRDSLGKSRRALTEQLALDSFDAGDDEAWERLEEALIAADLGVETSAMLVKEFARDRFG
jgi:fused signal recognition particle receptor